MTKSALAVARRALAAARAAVPAYSSKFSKKTYTQHQLLAALAVRQFLKTDYRGIEQHLKDWSDLRAAIGLGEDVPDHSTLQKAAERLLEKKG
ncbi:MAG: transposase [Gemmataceae bacterium]|nr:transposase [Gemmataceae bacterium]